MKLREHYQTIASAEHDEIVGSKPYKVNCMYTYECRWLMMACRMSYVNGYEYEQYESEYGYEDGDVEGDVDECVCVCRYVCAEYAMQEIIIQGQRVSKWAREEHRHSSVECRFSSVRCRALRVY
jgi:hypothetical protein